MIILSILILQVISLIWICDFKHSKMFKKVYYNFLKSKMISLYVSIFW